MPCSRANNSFAISMTAHFPLEKPLDPCVAEYSVTELMRREACGSMCKLLLIDMVKKTGRVEQMTNRYIERKTDEYSSKRAWSSIGEQYSEGLTRGVIEVHKQWSKQGANRVQTGRQMVNPGNTGKNQNMRKQARQDYDHKVSSIE